MRELTFLERGLALQKNRRFDAGNMSGNASFACRENPTPAWTAFFRRKIWWCLGANAYEESSPWEDVLYITLRVALMCFIDEWQG
jgi:hypothetical protein